jgi:hypothetical protein
MLTLSLLKLTVCSVCSLAVLQYGCLVVNAPTANTVAAAEHGIALMCTLSRNVSQADASMKAGKWERTKYVGVSLVDKVLCIMGFGKVRGERCRGSAWDSNSNKQQQQAAAAAKAAAVAVHHGLRQGGGGEAAGAVHEVAAATTAAAGSGVAAGSGRGHADHLLDGLANRGATPPPNAAAANRLKLQFAAVHTCSKTCRIVAPPFFTFATLPTWRMLARISSMQVGGEVARRARGLGMVVLAYDPYASEEKARAQGVRLVSFDEALEQGDFFSLHMPLTPGGLCLKCFCVARYALR